MLPGDFEMPIALSLVLPWNFSPTVLLLTALAVAFYVRGMIRTAMSVSPFRHVAYFAGTALIYSALQTSLSYYASHMFFVLQLQHFILHDLGPVLLAVAVPGATLRCGLPRFGRSSLQAMCRALKVPLSLLLDARIATALYILSQLLWLLPPVAFDVMLSNRLFKIMNWTTVLGALPFWHLMLDSGRYPRARLRLRQRFLFLYLAMLPMTLASAALAFSQSNWYPVYAVCGRFLPISPVMDQELGGTAMWVPGAMLFGVVFFLSLARGLDQGSSAVTSSPEGMPPGPAGPSRGTAADQASGCRASAIGRG